jgi:hypothetical protein
VSTTADLVANCTQEPQHHANDEQDHPDRPKKRDPEKESKDEEEYAEGNHDASVVFICHRSESRYATLKTLRVRTAHSNYNDL